MRRVLLGAVLMLVILALLALTVTSFGWIPVNADGEHSKLESQIMPHVLRAAVARQAPREINPVPLSEENLKLGVMTYKATCVRCHSTPQGKANVFGQSFYPPAPQLAGGMRGYTDSQLFWIIKHGIRNTGMPASGDILSDEQIWQIASLLKNAQDLPLSVESEWNKR